MGGHELAYFTVVIEHCDSWNLRLLEAAEGDTSRKLVPIRHLIVRRDIYLRWFKSVHIEDAESYIVSVTSSSLIAFLSFHEERLPLLEVPWFLDPCILEDDMTFFFSSSVYQSCLYTSLAS